MLKLHNYLSTFFILWKGNKMLVPDLLHIIFKLVLKQIHTQTH